MDEPGRNCPACAIVLMHPAALIRRNRSNTPSTADRWSTNFNLKRGQPIMGVASMLATNLPLPEKPAQPLKSGRVSTFVFQPFHPRLN
jgi:hypothetical protein